MPVRSCALQCKLVSQIQAALSGAGSDTKRLMKRLQIPIYGGRLWFTRSGLEFDRAYDRLVRRLGAEPGPPLGAVSGQTVEFAIDGELLVLCYLAHRSARLHEAIHVAQAVARHVGMDPLVESEAFAYLGQWCFDGLA